jgi:hypothetical protein
MAVPLSGWLLWAILFGTPLGETDLNLACSRANRVASKVRCKIGSSEC